MATKVIHKRVKVVNEESSSAGILAIVALVLLLAVGFMLYSQGYFGGNESEFNVNLPNGQTISGSVEE